MNRTVIDGARKELSLVMVSVESYLEDGAGLDIARASLNKLKNLLIFDDLNEAAEVASSISMIVTRVLDKTLMFEDRHWGALIDALVGLDSFLSSCLNTSEGVQKNLEYSREAITSLQGKSVATEGDDGVELSEVSDVPVLTTVVAETTLTDPSVLEEPITEWTGTVLEIANAPVQKPTLPPTNEVAISEQEPPQSNEVDDIDPEILEIFQEEATEELETIQSQYAIWKLDPGNKDAIENTRRSFHTLKGSGNVVGAKILGGFAASGEALFARVIVGQLMHSTGLLVLLDDFVATMATVVENLFSAQPLPLAAIAAVEARALNFPEGEKQLSAKAEPSDAGDQKTITVTSVDTVAEERLEVDTPELFCSMEDSLYEIFAPESNLHIDRILEFIAEAGGTQQIVTPELVTAIHTLHGSSRLAGAEAMSKLSDAMEAYCSALQKLSRACDPGALALLRRYADTMRDSVCAINTPLDNAPEWLDLLGEINLARKELKSSVTEQEEGAVKAANAARVDVAAFLLKAIDNMAAIHESFSKWKAMPDCLEPRERFEADLSRFRVDVEAARLTDVASLLLTMESLLKALPDFDDEFVNQLQQGITSIEDVFDNLYLQQPLTDLAPIREKLQAKLEPCLKADERENETEFSELQAVTGPNPEELEPGQQRVGSAQLKDLDQANDLTDWPDLVEEDLEFLEFEFIDTDEEIAPEVLELFLEEAGELVDQLEEAHAEWLLDPDSVDAMDAQLRHLHTFKGNALVANLRSLGGLGHFLESLFEQLVSGERTCSKKLLELVRAAFDGIQDSVEKLGQNKPLPRLQPLTDAVKAALLDQEWGDLTIAAGSEQETGPGDQPDHAVEQEIESNEAEVSASRGPSSQPLQKPAFNGQLVRPEAPPSIQPEKDTGEDQRVRVLSSALDRLINTSGEISITQANLDIQQRKDKYSLLELKTTIARLQRQLATLNVETEAQIISRHQDEQPVDQHDSNFDPLEMDRYSTLQQITRSINETVSDLSEIGDILDQSSDDTDSLMQKASVAARDVRDGLLKTLMIPLKDQYTRFQRVVRMAAQGEGKEVELEMLGVDGHIERNLLEKIVGPIEHLLRNAVAHGIELPEVREGRITKGSKPRQGKIQLSFLREISYMEIVISDDGAGINNELIREAAIRRGLLEADAEISDEELYQFIMAPGFSTASEVSAIAGRGVGMDAVMDGVQKLGGTISITSERGEGTTFTIRLPSMLSLVESLTIEVAEEVYVIPHGGVDSVVKLRATDVLPNYEQTNPSLEHEGKTYELYYLGSMLGLSAPPPATAAVGEVPLLLAQVGQRSVAVQVDYLVGTSKVQVVPIGDQFKRYPWFVDGTLLTSGKIALLLDVKTLLRERDTRSQPLHAVEQVVENKPRIMIVDDSITLRKITSRIFERQNMDVVTAKDGVEAITLMQESIPDVMLLDVEMPRMNGYELAQHMGKADGLKDIPIIMITSRTGEKHKQKGLELGVRYYLGKPFHEPELLECVHKLLEEKSNEQSN